jgi:hypothetical protein
MTTAVAARCIDSISTRGRDPPERANWRALMRENKPPRPVMPNSFRIADWREIFDIYPDQWLAIAVDEITLGVGITAGHIIARGKRERPVREKLKQFRVHNPEQEIAFLYTGPMVPSSLDTL